MISKNSTYPTQQTAIAETQQQVQELLHWSAEKYSFNMYRAGLAFLDDYLSGWTTLIMRLSAKPEFWNWWKNQWALRDQVFAESITCNPVSIENHVRLYEMFNNPAVLASELAIPRVVYGPDVITAKLCAKC